MIWSSETMADPNVALLPATVARRRLLPSRAAKAEDCVYPFI
ncbi:hypothetical protein AB395_0000697 [Sinorhizobium fredii CCBAU 45436]|nr:hypothetical protein AB395_0000697 [Sinorhizobium fredii CCBAU 45436]